MLDSIKIMDGLEPVVSRSGRLLDQLRKRILKIFEAKGLSITRD